MKPLLEALRQLGVQGYSTRLNGCPPLVVFGGGIKGGKARIRGDVSSQFISGLLFSTPMAESDTEIVLASPLQSRPYVEVTLDVLRKHGINVEIQPSYVGFHVPCGQKYAPFDHAIEGDYSSAAFLLVAAAVTNSQVKVENLNPDSLQGDRLIAGLLREIGIQIEVSGGYVEVHGMAGKLRPVDVDLRDNPDLVPVVAVSACLAEGKSVIRGVKRLRIKESDRIAALSSELAKFGVKTKATDDVFEIIGGRRLRGADLDSHGDHRIAMACVVAALAAEGTSVIRGVECINKSYPSFVKDIRALGGEVAER